MVGVAGADDLAPQAAAFHDIGFFHRMQLARTAARQFEREIGDPRDFAGGVGLGVDAALAAVGQVLDHLRLAEIKARSQFADKDHVGAAGPFRYQRRGVEQGLGHTHRAQVGEDIHFLAHAQQAAAFAHLARDIVIVIGARGAEQHGVGGQHIGQGFVGQHLTGPFISLVAVMAVRQVQGHAVLVAGPFQHPARLGGDFEADAVAGQDHDGMGVCAAHRLIPSRRFARWRRKSTAARPGRGLENRRYHRRIARSSRYRPSPPTGPACVRPARRRTRPCPRAG